MSIIFLFIMTFLSFYHISVVHNVLNGWENVKAHLGFALKMYILNLNLPSKGDIRENKQKVINSGDKIIEILHLS